MSSRSPLNSRLPLYLTPEHPCSYYDDRQARTVFGDPRIAPDAEIQTQLAQQGFRRSGGYLYRPQCPGCNACLAARVSAGEFTMNRSQRRNVKKNFDLDLSVQQPWCDDALLAMYNRYQAHRHPDGQMLAPTEQQFREFLLSDWSETHFLEIRSGDQLLGISVFDRLEDGLSAVYTFFDPDAAGRGLGTFAILKLIELAADNQLPWVYLGYWLPEHPKMDYKRRFRPLELLLQGEWRRLQFDKA